MALLLKMVQEKSMEYMKFQKVRYTEESTEMTKEMDGASKNHLMAMNTTDSGLKVPNMEL